MGKSGKSIISMAIFNSKLLVYHSIPHFLDNSSSFSIPSQGSTGPTVGCTSLRRHCTQRAPVCTAAERGTSEPSFTIWLWLTVRHGKIHHAIKNGVYPLFHLFRLGPSIPWRTVSHNHRVHINTYHLFISFLFDHTLPTSNSSVTYLMQSRLRSAEETTPQMQHSTMGPLGFYDAKMKSVWADSSWNTNSGWGAKAQQEPTWSGRSVFQTANSVDEFKMSPQNIGLNLPVAASAAGFFIIFQWAAVGCGCHEVHTQVFEQNAAASELRGIFLCTGICPECVQPRFY